MSFHDNSSQIVGDGAPISIRPDGMVRFGNDSTVNVHFYKKVVHDAALSAQHGRPFSVSRVYVRIQHPGEKDYADDPVESKPGIKDRFARQWEQFEKREDQIPDGTPVEMLFPQQPEIAANLHTLAVHTIEQLAGITEHGAGSIGMGATQWRNKAKEFLEKANKGIGIHQFEKEKEQLLNKIEVQDNQIAQMKTQLDRLMAQLQGVPGAMIPNGVAPMAQGHAMGVHVSPATQYVPPATMYAAPSTPTDWTAPYVFPVAPATLTPTPPQAPGRPRGRPRKTPTIAEGTT